MGLPLGSHEETCPHGKWSWQPCDKCIAAGTNMMQIIPMTVDDALKAADTYKSIMNGTMVDVLAKAVRDHRAALSKACEYLHDFQWYGITIQESQYIRDFLKESAVLLGSAPKTKGEQG